VVNQALIQHTKKFVIFMTMRIRGLTDLSKSKQDVTANKNKSSNRASVNNVTASKRLNCSGNHRLTQWDDFKRKSLKRKEKSGFAIKEIPRQISCNKSKTLTSYEPIFCFEGLANP